ncbi:putative toxin-antitoxin system toxin component, PIN family [Azospirillum sp. B4]|uniref:putative toxin-antitoxin system toxin component, PIN family n=1 Tax=Azospirillum sp. B4 TaxID=95605 RepID=UPI0005C8BD2A|nr:putative toxin-antitoxin system toxin component, PIN family [Azospirillum sp. B4]
MIRVVIDTNVFLSAFATRQGTASQAIDLAVEQGIVIASDETYAELAAKLASSRFALKLGTEDQRMEYLGMVGTLLSFVDVTSIATASPDPKDNMFLALAVDGRATCIVSGDKKHLLALGSYQGVPILSPADFLSTYRPA